MNVVRRSRVSVPDWKRSLKLSRPLKSIVFENADQFVNANTKLRIVGTKKKNSRTAIAGTMNRTG